MEKLKLTEAAEYADKSTSWIRKKILAGDLAAEKEAFKYGERWITTKKAIDDLLDQAKTDKEVVEVREVNKPVVAEDLINKLLEQLKGQNKELIDEAADEIKETIKKEQQESISQLTDKVDQVQQQNIDKVDQAAGEVKEVIKNQNKKIDQQQELIKKLSDQVEEMKQRQNIYRQVKRFF